MKAEFRVPFVFTFLIGRVAGCILNVLDRHLSAHLDCVVTKSSAVAQHYSQPALQVLVPPLPTLVVGMFSSDEDELDNRRHAKAPRLADTPQWSDIGVPAPDVVGVARTWQATLTTMLSGLRDPLGDQKQPLRL